MFQLFAVLGLYQKIVFHLAKLSAFQKVVLRTSDSLNCDIMCTEEFMWEPPLENLIILYVVLRFCSTYS